MKVLLTSIALLVSYYVSAQEVVRLKHDTLLVLKIYPGTFVQIGERVYGIDKDSILYELAPRLHLARDGKIFRCQWPEDSLWRCKWTILRKI